jgi:hypothetical protein
MFWLGLAGYALAVVRRPLLLAFAPLLGLALASLWLGVRFTMTRGGPPGPGLLRRTSPPRPPARPWRWASRGRCLLLLTPCICQRGLPPNGALPGFAQPSRPGRPWPRRTPSWHGGITVRRAVYAGATPSATGAHSGGGSTPWPWATQHLPAQAAGIMPGPGGPSPGSRCRRLRPDPYPPRRGIFSVDPWPGWRRWAARRRTPRRRMARNGPPFPGPLPEQYFIVAWANALPGILSSGNAA